MKIIAYNHTHWDREWYKSFQEFRMRFAEVMDLIIQEIDNQNIDCFYLDGQTVILEDYFELFPERKDLIKNLISQNKIIIGPWYALADEFLVSGESLYRNMFLGIKQSKELGCNKFLGYLPDSFGHNSEIPRILSHFGINNAVLWRGAGDNKSEFVWKSLDESSVLATYLIEGYFQNYLHYPELSTEQKASKLKEFLDNIKKFAATEYILLPVGGDHLGPVLNLKKLIQDIAPLLEGYTFEKGGVFEYLEKVEKLFLPTPLKEGGTLSREGATPPPYTPNIYSGELRDNSRNPILPGTLSTRMYLKQANAVSTWKLSKIAEPFYSLLQRENIVNSKNHELEQAWKILLKNHPHDSICGCSIDEVHDEMMSGFLQVNQISDGLVMRGQNAVSNLVKSKDIWVYNASDYEFSGVFKVKTSKPLPKCLKSQYLKTTREFPKHILLDTQRPPFSEDMEDFKEYLVYAEKIPPHSIQVLESSGYSQENALKVAENSIENSRIKLEVFQDGSVKFTDFELNKTYEGLHVFYDRADIGDTYNFDTFKGDVPLKSKLLKTKIIEKGELRSVLRVFYEIEIPECFNGKSGKRSKKVIKTTLITDISLTCNSKRAEFVTNWENKSKNHILQIKFELKDKITETFAENTFGIIKREFHPEYDLQNYIPAEKGKELKTNTAPMQRFVWAQGLGIITEGLTEYEVLGNGLYITALRSVGILSGLALNTRNFPAGPPLETFGAQCLGKCTAKYAICLTESPEELFKESDEFYGSIISDVGTSKNSSFTKKEFLNFDNENIYTYAIKPAENEKGIICRVMNLSCKQQKISLEAFEVNGFEEIIKEAQEFVFKPYELKNLLLKDLF
jgi:alpha-mannosidase